MFSSFIKYISGQNSFQAQRHQHDISQQNNTCVFLPSIAHYDVTIILQIFNENGLNPINVNVLFPSGKYTVLDFTPIWEHHRFIGWYKTSTTPSQTANTSGTKINSTDAVQYNIHDVHARWQLPATVVFDATTNGGQMPDGWISPDYYIGQQYGILPIPRNDNGVFTGWYTSSNELVSNTSIVKNDTLTARYDNVVFGTKFEVEITSEYYKVGIYSAEQYDSSTAIIVDWGDGQTDTVSGNISQLIHSYTNPGTYVVRISDNISSFALSNSSGSTWVASSTNNADTIRKILDVSSKVTTIPSYGFYDCYSLHYIYMGSSGDLTLDTNAFRYCAYRIEQPAIFDFSGRSISAIPNLCFQYCAYLKAFYWPKNVKTVGNNAFANCFQYEECTGSTVIPEGVTTLGSYAFRRCYYLASIILPSTLTSINGQAFGGCTALSSITSNIVDSSTVTVTSTAFGSSTTATASIYVGRNTYSTGTNRLYVPAGAIGYDTSPWSDVLLDPDKCGFTKEEI